LGLAVFLEAVWPTSLRPKHSLPPKAPSPLRPTRAPSPRVRIAVQTACIALAGFGVVNGVVRHYDRGRTKAEQSEVFYRELEAIAGDPDKLYITWGASFPIELLRPTDSLQWLANLRNLSWGWSQQCPFHDDMKLVFGLSDVARELADRPDVMLICDPVCLPLLATYIREHHGREITFERTGKFLTAVVARAVPASPAVIASQKKAPRQ
jgi:hypothetical protein